ncbi:MAG: sulfurtransferase-like selenium metabolism protein YedF [Thermodesulfobacteriota bacterium]|nr:sulfurtransferase-like selenium metabolism protein YedF [Thermodesulfobacteriota bacterium]
METIDARGLACPAPVLQTRSVLDEKKSDTISVIVDNDAAAQNVTRFLNSRGMTTETTIDGGIHTITGRAGENQPAASVVSSTPEQAAKIMVMVTCDRLGRGDDTLGGKLMINYIKTLAEMGGDLWRLVFVNSGVRLSIKDSPVLADLQTYQCDGLKILVCGTCLDYFNLLEHKAVGETTNMLDIVTAMQLADKVITI